MGGTLLESVRIMAELGRSVHAATGGQVRPVGGE